jgi:hypothetical protein
MMLRLPLTVLCAVVIASPAAAGGPAPVNQEIPDGMPAVDTTIGPVPTMAAEPQPEDAAVRQALEERRIDDERRAAMLVLARTSQTEALFTARDRETAATTTSVSYVVWGMLAGVLISVASGFAVWRMTRQQPRRPITVQEEFDGLFDDSSAARPAVASVSTSAVTRRLSQTTDASTRVVRSTAKPASRPGHTTTFIFASSGDRVTVSR